MTITFGVELAFARGSKRRKLVPQKNYGLCEGSVSRLATSGLPLIGDDQNKTCDGFIDLKIGHALPVPPSQWVRRKPAISCLEQIHDQQVLGIDLVAGLDEDFGDHPVLFRVQRRFHLHRFDGEQQVAAFDRLAGRNGDR